MPASALIWNSYLSAPATGVHANDGQELDDRAGGWRGLGRARYRATSGARRQEGDGGKCCGEKFAVGGHRVE